MQVDLGADRTVVAVVVKHAGAGGESDDWNTRDFDILLSRDGKQYETAAQVTRSEARVTSHSIAPSTARFVKLVVHKPGQNDEDAARIYELEVWGR